MMRKFVTLRRESTNQLQPEKIKTQLKKIAASVQRNHQRGLEGVVSRKPIEPEKMESGYRYTAKIGIIKNNARNAATGHTAIRLGIEVIQKVARQYDWVVLDENETQQALPQGEKKPKVFKVNLNFTAPTLNEEVVQTRFGRVYEREPHIRILHQAAITAAKTNFKKRRHVLLHGLPACAKSEILLAFKDWYNTDGEFVMSLDATTTTKAGLETLILQKATDEELPPFLLLEEIEKHDPKTLLCLLAVMDQRGTIQRTNARIGNVSAQAKIVVWATCNDDNKLRNFEGGALWSRFNHRLACSRPSRDLMKRILERECVEMDASPECIESILDFGYREIGTTDPREFIALLDGHRNIKKYLADYRLILQAKKDEEETEKTAFIS